jgi:hypothetical protein
MGFLIMGVIGYVVKLSEFLLSFLLTNCSLRMGRLTRFFSFQSTFPSTTSSSVALKRFVMYGNCMIGCERCEKWQVGKVGEEEQKSSERYGHMAKAPQAVKMVAAYKLVSRLS